jgi:hypothetical protein
MTCTERCRIKGDARNGLRRYSSTKGSGRKEEDAQKKKLSAGKGNANDGGYYRVTVWVKDKYRARIDPAAKGQARIEEVALDATGKLSEKTKKGFLEYLRKHDYQPLLK